MDPKQFFSDAYSPNDIARKVESMGVGKAHI
ncbi:MAG: formate transporter FocA, partial [Candidatus Electrothrix sp. AR3]|nr:formate transporter FocA [Candidatus Electrothrix sp. AR3]